MQVTAMFTLSWQKLLGSFEDSNGSVLPQKVRKTLLKYFTEGVIPEGFLYYLLIKDFENALDAKKTQLEAQRLQTIWQFLQNCVPLRQWGSKMDVENYSLQITSGALGTIQANYYDSKRLVENNIFDREDIHVTD